MFLLWHCGLRTRLQWLIAEAHWILSSELKELALLHLWRKLQLWLGFNSWPRNFHILLVRAIKKKKKCMHLDFFFFLIKMDGKKPQMEYNQ